MIPQSIRVSWGAGALGVALLMNAIGILALFYLVNVLGMEPALAERCISSPSSWT